MGRILLIIIVLGGMLAWFGFQEWRLASAASTTPQTIACADLEAKGPGNNAHVILTDFLLCPSGFVYESSSKGNDSSYTKIWIPAVPLHGEYMEELKKLKDSGKDLSTVPPPKNVRVIVRSSHVHNDGELEKLGDRDTIQGLIVNKVDSLGSKEKEILAGQYPGINLDTCWILDEGRTPRSFGTAGGMIGGGVLLALIGVGGFVLSAKKG